jgi:hypothetical protein
MESLLDDPHVIPTTLLPGSVLSRGGQCGRTDLMKAMDKRDTSRYFNSPCP